MCGSVRTKCVLLVRKNRSVSTLDCRRERNRRMIVIKITSVPPVPWTPPHNTDLLLASCKRSLVLLSAFLCRVFLCTWRVAFSVPLVVRTATLPVLCIRLWCSSHCSRPCCWSSAWRARLAWLFWLALCIDLPRKWTHIRMERFDVFTWAIRSHLKCLLRGV